MIDMPKDLPKYVYPERNRHGRVRLVFRRKGSPRHYMQSKPGTKEFMAEYAKVLSGEFPDKAPNRGTLKWLIELYLDSGTFQRYAKNTRNYRASMLRRNLKKNPNAMVSDILPVNISQAMDKLSPQMANEYLKAMRALFKWGIETGNIKSDPTVGVTRVKVETVEQPIWLDEDMSQYRNYWPVGSLERLVFEVIYYGGFALADACRLSRPHIKKGVIELPRQKTGVIQYVTITPEFEAHLSHGGEFVFLLTRRGKNFTAEKLGSFLLKARRKAGLGEHCKAHGLRRKRAVDLAEQGKSASELMAWFGWDDIKEAELYTKKADRRKLSRSAME